MISEVLHVIEKKYESLQNKPHKMELVQVMEQVGRKTAVLKKSKDSKTHDTAGEWRKNIPVNLYIGLLF